MKKNLRMMKKAFALCATTITVSFFIKALAQNAAPDSFPNRSANDLLRSYQNSRAGTVEGQELLIGVLNKRLPATDDNLQAVRTSLAKARAPDDKILLAKVLASMYTTRVRSQQNVTIEGDIKGLVNSPDPRVAKEAVIEYSRLGYPPDRYQVLQRARAAKVIGDDAYFGELAHGLRFSSREDQSKMLAELEGARNPFANEVLASTFGQRQLLGQLKPDAQTRLLKLLSDQEPAFPLALDSFGLVDAIRYAIWIGAVATIDSTLSGRPFAQLVVARLSNPRIDPRKILAVFVNAEGKRVINESTDIAQLRLLLERAQIYSNSLPQNVMLKSATATFSSQLSARESTELKH